MFILMGVFFQIKSPALRDDISPGKINYSNFEIIPKINRVYGGGAIMPAISVKVGTKYDCNNNILGDEICLQSRKFLKYLESDRLGSKSYLKKFENAGIYGPNQN